MIVGALMIVVGLALGLKGSFDFNFGTMVVGYIIAGVGAVVFLDHLIGAFV